MAQQNPRTEAAPRRASDPAFDAIEFTADADKVLATHSRAIYVAADGNLQVKMVGYNGTAGATVTFTGVKGGSILPIAVSEIVTAGTTVAGLALI